MKKVLLVNPHETSQEGYTNPPLGLLYIAGTLLKHGVSVKLVDGCVEGKNAIIKAIGEFKPDIVGITSLTPGRKRALDVARLVRAADPATLIVMGGAHPTIMYRQILEEYDYVDLVVLGEGERTFLEIVTGTSYESIQGIAYRRDNKVVKTGERATVANLDELPFPAWNLVDLSRYKPWGTGSFNGIDISKVPRVSVIFSRGCTGHCDFCSTWWVWKGYRNRSPENMADELEWLYRDFGVRHFCFADDAFSIDREAIIGLCDEIIRRKMIIAFFANTRSDFVDEELLYRMKQAGCYEVSYGIETGSQHLLNGMTKENTIKSAEMAIKMTKQAGLKATALMIVGNVGETEETVQETLAFLKRAKPDQVASAGGLWILPGTKVYQYCRKIGFIDDDFWLSDEPYKVFTLEHSSDWLSAMNETLYTYCFRSRFARLRSRVVIRIVSLIGKYRSPLL